MGVDTGRVQSPHIFGLLLADWVNGEAEVDAMGQTRGSRLGPHVQVVDVDALQVGQGWIPVVGVPLPPRRGRAGSKRRACRSTPRPPPGPSLFCRNGPVPGSTGSRRRS